MNFKLIHCKLPIFTLSIPLSLILIITMIGCSKSTKVTRVVDGCTVEVEHNGKKEVVKLLGIEVSDKTGKFYNDAKLALSKMVDGKKVKLEFDNSSAEERDDLGNLVCFVYVGGTNVNVEMVRLGYCHFSPGRGAEKMTRKFENAESEARMNRVGIWK